MNVLASDHPSDPANKRTNFLVTSCRTDYSLFSTATHAGFEKNYKNNGNENKLNSSKKKMKSRRNSLTFPLPNPGPVEPNPTEEIDSFDDLVRKRFVGSIGRQPFPMAKEIDKVLGILDSTSHSERTSVTETSLTESSEEEESIHDSKRTHAIATPVPAKKNKLQIPAEKRKKMALLGTTGSPTSVIDSLNLLAGSMRSENDKGKSRKPKSSISPAPATQLSPDPPGRKGSKKNRKHRKKVHFKQTCTMRRTLSRRDMTPKEIRRTWLSSEEYSRMQLRDEILADRVDEGKIKPGTCTRGLESKIEVSAMKKLELRMNGVDEVLSEQDRQWDDAGDSVTFYYDFSAFADVYGPVSEQALITAQAIAKEDRKEATKILASSSLFKSKGVAGFVKRSRFTRRRSWA